MPKDKLKFLMFLGILTCLFGNGHQALAANFVSDTFTDTSGTVLTAHIGQIGATWTKHPAVTTGQAIISPSGDLRSSSSSVSYYYASGVPATADYDVAADFASFSNVGGNSQVSIWGRMSTTSISGYYLQYTAFTGLWAWGVYGGFTATTSIPDTSGNVIHGKLMIRGNTITPVINGITQTPFTDSTITNKGVVGLSVNVLSTDTSGVHIRNFSATDAVYTPTVTAQAATSISTSSAVLNGNLTSTGSSTVTIEGFNYGTTTAYGLVASSTGSFATGAYAQTILGLMGSTTYHYQAFATNSYGTATSSDQIFTTLAPATQVILTSPTFPEGPVSEASQIFTLSANGYILSPFTITLSDNGGGGSFSSSTLTLSPTSTSTTFTYTPATTGTTTISMTNSGSLTNPASVGYTSLQNFVSDSLVDNAGTVLTSHTGQVGATWTKSAILIGSADSGTDFTAGQGVIGSTTGLYSNQNYKVAYYASGAPTSADYTVAGKFLFLSCPASTIMGILGRYSVASSSFYSATYGCNGSGGGNWSLGKIANSTSTILASSSVITYAASTSMVAQLRMSGSSLFLLVNGQQLLSASDTSITSPGAAGIVLQTYSTNATPTTGIHTTTFEASQASNGLPGVPQNLTITTATTSANLTWTAPLASGPAVSNYTIQYKLTASSSWSLFPHATSTATTTTISGLTTDTSYDFQVAAVNSNGTGPFTATTTAFVESAPASFALPNSQVYAPGWLALSDRIITQHPGEYFKFAVQNTSIIQLNLDTSALTSNINVESVIDGVVNTVVTISPGNTKVIIASGLSAGLHQVLIEVQSLNNNAQRWTDQTTMLQVKNILLDQGATLYSPSGGNAVQPTHVIWDTDSLGEYDSTTNNDASTTFPTLISNYFGWEHEHRSFSGIGYINTYTVNPPLYVPGGAVNQPMNAYDSNDSELVNGQLQADAVVIALGTNDQPESDSALVTRVENDLTYLRSIFQGSIYLLLPMTVTGKNSDIIAAATAYASSTPSDSRVHVINIGATDQSILSSQTIDGTHLTVSGQANAVAMLEPLFAAAFDTPTSPQIVIAVASGTQATVSFSAPSSDGGSAVTGYTAVSSPGNISASASTSPIVVTGLTRGVSYSFNMFAINAVGTSTGSTSNSVFIPALPPTLTLQSASSISTSSATLNGSMTADGGASSTIEGFNYGTTTSYGLIASSTGSFDVGSFGQSVTGLVCGTTYHFQAFAINSAGTGTSTDSTFTTNACVVIPTLSTSAASSIGTSSATFNGSITADGLASSTAEGFNLGTTTAYGATTTQNGTFGVGSFSTTTSGLTPNTLYHYRSYATNSAGTGYGSDQTFTSNPVTYTLAYTAGSNGTLSGSSTQVVASGSNGSAVTAVPNLGYHFVSWSDASTSNPRTDVYVGSNVTVTANFAFTITPIVLSTLAATGLSTSTATFNGQILATGGANATQSGFAYGTSSSLATVIATTTLGAQTGTTTFSQSFTNLTPNQTYYFRAYAVNSAGTTTGSILSFNTNDVTAPVVTLTTPTNGQIVAGSAVQLSATASDDVGVVGVQFKVGANTNIGSLITSTSSPNTYTTTWDSTGFTAYGSHTLYAVAHDAAGNYSTSTVSVTVDNVAPTIISAVYNSSTQITVTLSAAASTSTITKANNGGFTVTKTGSGTTYAVSSIAPGASTTLVILTTADMTTAGGAGVVVTYANGGNGTIADTLGNILATNNTGITVPPWNTTAPIISSITSNVANGNYTIGAPIDIDLTFSKNVNSTGSVLVTLNTGGTCSFSVANSNTASCTYTVASGQNAPALNVASTSGTLTSTDSNAMTSFAPALNLADNKSIDIDTTAPTVTLRSPTASSIVSGHSVTFSATAGDVGTGVAGVQFKLDGTDVGSEILSAPYSETWDSTAVADGAHTLSAVAVDGAGNAATSTISFNTDNSTYTVGGAVSGLTGTLVLQDNGSDNRTISSNGPFAFAATVLDNHPYAVTILTQPSGQTCAVSNGSGTLAGANVTSVAVTCTSNPVAGGNPVPYLSLSGSSGGSGGSVSFVAAPGGGYLPVYGPVPAASAGIVTASPFTATLAPGSQGPDVLRLQQFLAKLGYLEATPNGSFGPLTTAAVKAYQGDHGLPQVGQVGPATRQLLNAAIVSADQSAPAASNAPVSYQSFLRDLDLGSTGNDVKTLQRYLNAHGFAVAPTGPGSSGHETSTFGPATQAALARFQKANGIVPAVGYFGPVTRRVVNGQ